MPPSSIPRPVTAAAQPLGALAELLGVPIQLIGVDSGRGAGEDQQGQPTESEAWSGVLVTGITLRSGEVQPGDLFAAIAGERSHGARAIPAALEAGAVAVVTDPAGVEIARALDPPGLLPVLVVPKTRAVLGELGAQIYGRPSEKLMIIGVTGTSGKTTTCYLIEAGLAACGLRTGVIGTVETRIGREALPSMFTTPEAPDLQALLQVMVEHGVHAVAMEVSSHALVMDRVAATRFAVGAFTNLSQDHLDFHGDIESYFEAKAMLFDGRAAAGVVDVDGEFGRRLAERHPALTTVSVFGPGPADWTVPSIDIGAAGITNLVVRGPLGEELQVALQLPGSFNVSNAVLALACIAEAGLDVKLAANAITSVVVPGRMQSVDCGQDFLAVVDYAHKPAALAAVLAAIRPTATGRLIVVIGAGGDRDRGKRPMMGAEAARGAELVIVTDDNPRTEDAAQIRAQVLAGITAGAAEVREIGDRRSAIRAAVAAASSGDAVVIAGKGHEQGQYVGSDVIPFSDVDELSEALDDRRRDLHHHAEGTAE